MLVHRSLDDLKATKIFFVEIWGFVIKCWNRCYHSQRRDRSSSRLESIHSQLCDAASSSSTVRTSSIYSKDLHFHSIATMLKPDRAKRGGEGRISLLPSFGVLGGKDGWPYWRAATRHRQSRHCSRFFFLLHCLFQCFS